jgi:hypothetical protein
MSILQELQELSVIVKSLLCQYCAGNDSFEGIADAHESRNFEYNRPVSGDTRSAYRAPADVEVERLNLPTFPEPLSQTDVGPCWASSDVDAWIATNKERL